jgi:hypothetical protein
MKKVTFVKTIGILEALKLAKKRNYSHFNVSSALPVLFDRILVSRELLPAAGRRLDCFREGDGRDAHADRRAQSQHGSPSTNQWQTIKEGIKRYNNY